MGKKLVLSILLALFFMGCAPEFIPVAEPSLSPAPVFTNTPSPTPIPTPSPTPEITPIPVPKAFSLIWISDTQNMLANNAAPIHGMTQWIAENREALNIRYVVHTGDVVSNGTRDADWDLVLPAFQKLPKDLPLMTIAGNHDVGEYWEYDTYLRRRLDTPLPEEQLFQGGLGSYATLETDVGKFLIAGMSMKMGTAGYDWLNAVLARYPDHICILALHDYLVSGKRHSSEGERVFRQVVKHNPNVRFVLCGHNRGVALKRDRVDDDKDRKADRIVYQMLYNFQDDIVQMGYLRILTFQTDGSLQVTTYSPWLDDYNYYPSRNQDETFLIPDAFPVLQPAIPTP